MKNYQKNSRNPSVPFSCMFEQPKSAVCNNLNKWHLKCLMWSLNLNLGCKPTSSNMVASCISSINIILPCDIHVSSWCIALIVFFLCLSVLFPLGRCCTAIVIVDTDEDSMLSSEVPGKQNPLVHSDTILLSRLLSFTALRQHRFNCYMLR